MRVNQKKHKFTRAKHCLWHEHEQGSSFTTVINQLTQQERCVCEWRRLGFTSRQVAQCQGNSVSAVESLYSQAIAKIRRLLK